MSVRPSSGFSLVELLVVAALVATTAAVALPIVRHAADAADGAAAARHLAALVARARVEAARRQRTVALRFESSDGEPRFALVVDGDGDGVAAADVTAGVDWVLRPFDTLAAHFPRARIGIAAAVPGIDGEPLSPVDAAVRLGAAAQVSISPLGTATSGTIYVASRGGAQYALRIAGVTGRVRLLRYGTGTRQWQGI